MPQRRPIESLAFLIDGDGDTVMRADASGALDLVLVEDDEEVVQSLRLALLTRLGEDILHPDIGLPLDRIAAIGDATYAAGTVARSILQDDRIASASDVEADFPSEEDRAIRRLLVRAHAVLKDGGNVVVEADLGA
jgi:hypothetical protein